MDFSSAEWADPNIELVYADGPDPVDGAAWPGCPEVFRNVLAACEDVSATAEEYRELGNERVLVLDRRSGRGKASRLEIAEVLTEGATLWQVCDGKVTQLRINWDRQRALADLGLEE